MPSRHAPRSVEVIHFHRPSPGKAPRRRGLTRGSSVVKRVLEVTLEHLGEVGFDRLSVPRIAALAGVNKTSVYRRWPTREALVSAALTTTMGPTVPTSWSGDLSADLVRHGLALARFLESPRGAALVKVLLSDGAHPGLRQLAESSYASLGTSSRSRPALPRPVLELTLFTLAGAVIHRLLVERRPADPAHVRRIVRLLLNGALPRRAS